MNVQTRYGFAGEEQDPTSGQLFLQARTYNPATDEILKVMVEAEATLKGAGAQAEAEKETSTLDTNTESGDNDEAQLNSGADDEHRPAS